MSNYKHITVIANQLANEGKKPTVALIKKHLPIKAPLPEIISVLKSWEHNPEDIHLDENSSPAAEEKQTDQLPSDLESLLEAKISPLRAEIAELKTLINSLVK